MVTSNFPEFWFVTLQDRTQLEIFGSDRVTFLHNFCTQDVKKLTAGTGAEAFITSHQGKTLGYGNLFALEDRLLYDTTPGQAEQIRQHLDRFIISEQVEFQDRSSQTVVLWIAGNAASAAISALLGQAVPTVPLAHKSLAWTSGGTKYGISIRCGITAKMPYWMLAIPAETAADWQAALISAGAAQQSPETLTAFRIAANIPEYGTEVLDDNLPQEICRDAEAISFKKGCYLGQETVARLDALGHVNRVLRRIVFSGPAHVSPGLSLAASEKEVGKVLSSVKLPSDEVAAFAIIRRLNAAAGTELQSPQGIAKVL